MSSLNYLNDAYQKAFSGLTRTFMAYARRSGVDVKDVNEFVEWLVSVKRMEVGPETWRLYRNAVASTLDLNPNRWPSESLKTPIAELRKIRGLTKKQAQEFTDRPSGGSKAKSLTQDQLDLLGSQLKQPTRTYGLLTLIWFKCGLITGLRPNEWFEAKVVGSDPAEYLRVRNAKVVNYDDPELAKVSEAHSDVSGRCSFTHRTIPMGQFEESERRLIKQWLSLLSSTTSELMAGSQLSKEAAHELIFEKARKTIYAASMKIMGDGGKNITLYTARHIFRSRNRSALLHDGMPKEVADIWLAVLMGHSSTKTNYAYGTEGDSGKSSKGAIDISGLEEAKKAFLRQVLTEYS